MFKKCLLFLAVFGLVIAIDPFPALSANTAEALPIRVIYSATNVTSAAYVQLVASTIKGISGISVLNSGGYPVAIALGAAGSEVQQMVVPNANGSSPTPVVYPLQAGYGSRISVISLTGSNTSFGELDVNLFYN